MNGTARSFVSSRAVSVARRAASTRQVTKTIAGIARSSISHARAYRSGLARAMATASRVSTARIDMACSTSLAAKTMPTVVNAASASGGAMRPSVPASRADAMSAALAASTQTSQLMPGAASHSTAVLNPAISAELTHNLPSNARWVEANVSACGNGAIVICKLS
jgi:hypothetical protein